VASAGADVVDVVAGAVVVDVLSVVVGGDWTIVDGVVDEVGGGEDVTLDLGPVVAVVAVADVVTVDRLEPAVVVVVLLDEDDEDAGARVVVVAVVGGAKILVAAEPGWDRVDSPVLAEPLPSRETATAISPTTTTVTTAKITALVRVVALWASHQERSRSCAPGRPKAAFFPMDRPKR
jgi:hypothetical protein